jgi:hypothetical protein
VSDHKARGWEVGLAVIAAAALVLALDAVTNTIDRTRFSWDFRYYIDLAENGFSGSLASPFAYRYATPMLARWISLGLHLPIPAAFTVVAYIGAIAQLVGVFWFVRWYVQSSRGAWVAMLMTAFSLFHVKFLLFDPFRPDHLAYALIVLQSYLALKGKFVPLLICTLIGSQIREFNVIPLIAYLYASNRSTAMASPAETGKRRIVELLVSCVSLGAALILPRVLIPVGEDFQFATFSMEGILRPLLAPLILVRDVNFVYSLIAYTLPLLVLASPAALMTVVRRIKSYDRVFLAAYTALVVVFSFLGGTDFYRFSSYLLIPQGVLLGFLAAETSVFRSAIALASAFVFNRIWLPFPMSDLDSYLDFYGGSGTHFGLAGILRIVECGALIGLGWFVRLTLSRGHGWSRSAT